VELVSGVRERRLVEPGTTSSDLAAAGLKALHNADTDPMSIDLMIFAAAIANGRARRVLVTSGEVLSPTITYSIQRWPTCPAGSPR
jgi:hypothetical protein